MCNEYARKKSLDELLAEFASVFDAPPLFDLTGWFVGRLPDGWFTETPDILVDRDEILVMGTLAETLRIAAQAVWPFMPATAENLWGQLGLPADALVERIGSQSQAVVDGIPELRMAPHPAELVGPEQHTDPGIGQGGEVAARCGVGGVVDHLDTNAFARATRTSISPDPFPP